MGFLPCEVTQERAPDIPLCVMTSWAVHGFQWGTLTAPPRGGSKPTAPSPSVGMVAGNWSGEN